MSDTRFCKDCRWVTDTQKEIGFWKCVSPNNTETLIPNPLNGQIVSKRRFIYCETTRNDCSDKSCAPEGQWFEPK